MPQAPPLSCAICNLPLRQVRGVDAFSWWTCDGCRSSAAEIGSLEASIPRERIVRIEEQLGQAKRGDRSCPKCREPMRRATVTGGYGSIEIDGCGACRIAWFDRGELHNLRTTTASGSAPAPSQMTPEQRRAWRIEQLRAEGTLTEDESTAAIVGLVLGIPIPEHVEGQGQAYLTWGISLLATLTSVFAFANIDGAAARWGMIPADVRDGRLTGLVTSFFVHADPFHLVGNLVFFFLFGTRVEALIGRLRYVLLILAATVVAGLAHTVLAPDPSIPLIGASGGISGVLAAYVALRPKSKVRIMILYQVTPVPAWGFMAFWMILQLIGTAAQISGASAVSALAHLGGALTGLLLGFAWRSENLRRSTVRSGA